MASKALKIGAPLLILCGLGVFGWMFLESTGTSDDAGRAANAIVDAADRAIDAATADSRYRATEEPTFISIGAIYTSTVNVMPTVVARGSDGATTVCNRMAHVRDYLVTVLSDHPPREGADSLGPANYRGSLVEGLNQMLNAAAVVRIRFDPFTMGKDNAASSC